MSGSGLVQAWASEPHLGGDAIVTSGETNNLGLSKQMVNTAAMIERHYSELTATMAAEKLA